VARASLFLTARKRPEFFFQAQVLFVLVLDLRLNLLLLLLDCRSMFFNRARRHTGGCPFIRQPQPHLRHL